MISFCTVPTVFDNIFFSTATKMSGKNFGSGFVINWPPFQVHNLGLQICGSGSGYVRNIYGSGTLEKTFIRLPGKV
jgi:hypothetical protein